MAINFVFTVICVVDVAIGAYEENNRHVFPGGSPGPGRAHVGHKVING